MIGAGEFRDKATFQRESKTPDGGGGFSVEWQDQFDRSAALAFANLGRQMETIQQGELTAPTRGTLTVREDSLTRTITGEWRVSIREDGYLTRVWKIGEIQRPERGYLRMTVEVGG